MHNSKVFGPEDSTASREVRRVEFFWEDLDAGEEGDLFESPEEVLGGFIHSGIEISIDTTDYPSLYIEFSPAQVELMTRFTTWIGSDECWGPWLSRYYRYGTTVGTQTEEQLAAWWAGYQARIPMDRDDPILRRAEQVWQRYIALVEQAEGSSAS